MLQWHIGNYIWGKVTIIQTRKKITPRIKYDKYKTYTTITAQREKFDFKMATIPVFF